MARPMNVLFGEYLPDQPDFEVEGSRNITNVLPVTKGSYGPMPSLVAYTSSLPSTCLGNIFVRDSSANVYGFAGTSSKLYKFAAGSLAWADISVAGDYSLSAEEVWNFAVFGQRVVAVNIDTPCQTFLLGTSTSFSLLSSGAPMARYVAAPRDFMMVANTFDGTNGNMPQRVWWSALGDPTTWPTPGSAAAIEVQSDYQDLLGDGGWNQGLVAGLANADAVIWQERRMWRAVYIGSPAIFDFILLDAGRGTPAPGSIVQVGGVAYFISDSGIFVTDGASVQPIGDQKVDQTFWANVNTNFLYNISAEADPQRKLVFWAYPSNASPSGVPDSMLVYHYALNRFANITGLTLDMLAKGYTTGYTLDQTYTVLGYTLDNLPYPLDSRAWTGGRLSLGAFDNSHSFGFFQGSPMAAIMDTTEESLNGNDMAYVNRIWPLTDAAGVQVQLGTRNRLIDMVNWTNPVGITSTSGSAGVRATGKYHRARVTIPAGASWTSAQGIQVDARTAGKRA